MCLQVSMLRKMKRLDIGKYNIVEFIDAFPTQFGNALVFEALDISLYDYCILARQIVNLCIWVTSEPSSNRYEQSTIKWKEEHWKSLSVWGFGTFLLTCVLSVGHSTWRAEEERDNPHWCQMRQHNDGESSTTTPPSQADRLRRGHFHVTCQAGHASATTESSVRWITFIVTLEQVSYLTSLPMKEQLCVSSL